MSVVDFTENSPHIGIRAENGDCFVVPVSLVRDWIAGRAEPDPDVMRAIIAGWLRRIQCD